MNELIKLDDVSIGFGKTPIIRGIDLTLISGQFWGVIGPNGGGKSTLLKTVIGLTEPLSGSYKIKEGLRFGYVPQHEKYDNLFPVSVEEMVTMGRYSRVPFGGRLNQEDRETVRISIEKTGISKLSKKIFRELSGGEKQKVLIAKAICGNPDVLVLDEPTSSLDLKGEAEIMSLIKDLKDELNLTVIMVSHFADTISKYADSVILVDKDNGVFLPCSMEDAVCNQHIKRYFGLQP